MLKRFVLAAALALVAATAHAEDGRLADNIVDQGTNHSQVMKFVTELCDGIGARLMGSPNLDKAYAWSVRTMRALGAQNVHLEDIGEFGLSWRQNGAWLRLTNPDSMVFLAQAAPWSVSSRGPKDGEAVAVELNTPEDFAKYRGTLGGKIVLLGPPPDMPASTPAFTRHWSQADVLNGTAVARQRGYHRRRVGQSIDSVQPDFGILKARFLAGEKILAAVIPTPQMPTKGGETGLIVVEHPPFGPTGWTADTRAPFPILVTAMEDFGRVWRLANSGAKPHLAFKVDSAVLGEHQHAYNVVGEIPGSDPQLESQVVILGAHLDSWPAATGASDNGAGVAATLETLRILVASHAGPKRTVRFILYSGEEQGLLGSTSYVTSHLGYSKTGPLRSGQVVPQTDFVALDDHAKVSAVYNIDDGSGKILGAFSGGNDALAKVMQGWLPDMQRLGVVSVLNEPSYFSDGAPYASVGIPAISFLQDEMDYFTRTHHTNLDTVEHIAPEDLAQVATVAAIFVSKTADRPEPMPRVPQP